MRNNDNIGSKFMQHNTKHKFDGAISHLSFLMAVGVQGCIKAEYFFVQAVDSTSFPVSLLFPSPGASGDGKILGTSFCRGLHLDNSWAPGCNVVDIRSRSGTACSLIAAPERKHEIKARNCANGVQSLSLFYIRICWFGLY